MPIKTNVDPEPTLNLTPMIDIVFLLIIFFMVGTEFAEMDRQIRVDLPAVKHYGALTRVPKRRTIHVYKDNTIRMDHREYTVPELIAELKKAHEAHEETAIVIRGDGQTSLQNTANIMAACRDAGFDRLGIAVRAETIHR